MKTTALSLAERQAAEEQLAVCEGSDWFWWLGDYNAAASISSFDSLFRRNLSNLYRLLKQAVPKALSRPISVIEAAENAQAENAGTMKRGTAN
jgi:alpha-amylase/alpha-mannosidase (GH57 family)